MIWFIKIILGRQMYCRCKGKLKIRFNNYNTTRLRTPTSETSISVLFFANAFRKKITITKNCVLIFVYTSPSESDGIWNVLTTHSMGSVTSALCILTPALRIVFIIRFTLFTDIEIRYKISIDRLRRLMIIFYFICHFVLHA